MLQLDASCVSERSIAERRGLREWRPDAVAAAGSKGWRLACRVREGGHMRDIATQEDCAELVGRFYESVRTDPLLGPVFARRIDGRWPEHLATMERFWATVLLRAPLYSGRPIDRHVALPIDDSHFDRWLALWDTCVDARYAGAHAEHAKNGARRMAERMQNTLSDVRARPSPP